MSVNVDIPSYPRLILMFGMTGCDHCTSFEPVLRTVAERHPNVPTFAIDCGAQAEAANAFSIKNTPTTVLISHGRQVTRLEGMQSPEVVEMLFQKAEKLS